MDRLIEGVIWFAGMTLVMGWLARSRTKARPPAEAGTLRHPMSTLIVGLVCAGMFLAAAVASYVLPGEQERSAGLSLLFVGFALLGVPLVLDYVNARHALTADGMRYGKMLGATGAFRWADVIRLRYSPSMKWFRLDLADGRVVRLSVMLAGLEAFARAALEHVKPDAVAADTRPTLEATARGELPSVWQ